VPLFADTHPKVLCEDLTYPRVACFGAIVKSLLDAKVASRTTCLHATLTDGQKIVRKKLIAKRGRQEEGIMVEESDGVDRSEELRRAYSISSALIGRLLMGGVWRFKRKKVH
jgi:hypothetical protein